MVKMTASLFADIFEDYCEGVQTGEYVKIPYSTWRIINDILKKLKRESFYPHDWEKMPIYLDWHFSTITNEDSSKSSYVLELDIKTADKSVNFSNLQIPTGFITAVHDYLEIEDFTCEYDDYSCTDHTEPINKIENKKENETMAYMNASRMDTAATKTSPMNDMMPAFDFGPVTGDAVRVSPYGMAIKNKDGAWVSYNASDGSVITVSGFTFDLGQMLFKVPVALNQIQKGDMVIHNHVPMYVTDVAAGGKQVSVVDIREGEIKTVMPPTNMFGFNFVTKVVSFINFQTSTPDPNNPFGNIMPFIFMSSMFGGGENGEGGGLGDMFKGDMGKMMMYSMMFGGGQNPFANLFGGLMPQATPAAPAVPTNFGQPPVEVTNVVMTDPPQMV